MTQNIRQEIDILLHRHLRAAIYIRISSKKQDDDYSDEDDIIAEIFRLVRGYLGQEEHKNTAQRIQDGKLKKIEAGKLMGGGVALYGYVWNGHGKEATHYLLDSEIVAVGTDGHQ